MTLTLGNGRLPPHQYAVYVSLIAEYILGLDVLHSLMMQTTLGEYQLCVHVVKQYSEVIPTIHLWYRYKPSA